MLLLLAGINVGYLTQTIAIITSNGMTLETLESWVGHNFDQNEIEFALANEVPLETALLFKASKVNLTLAAPFSDGNVNLPGETTIAAIQNDILPEDAVLWFSLSPNICEVVRLYLSGVDFEKISK